ncbi:methionyl-tRNA synthetase [Blyttiomyces sp. JEL0837]|nr:methionyl-tRNA synthetase [Blyttiomyces sp. JEL0837]
MLIQEAAKKAKKSPLEFCDGISSKFKVLFDSADISYTDFIRTTEPRHYKAVHAMWNLLLERGYIYKGKHEGWYSISDETFYPASQVHEIKDSKSKSKTKMVSIETGKEVEWTTEENYKFKLSALQKELVQWLKADPERIIPQTHYKNILRALESDEQMESLADLSISRPKSRLQWGVPVPNDPDHVIYVWLDALTNYLTSTGFPWTETSQNKNLWPATWHVVGKDIIKFHAIYWPAFLIAAGLPPPKKILSHAHWLQNKTKMSKSLGNVTDPHLLLSQFGIDTVRYFLMRDGGIEYDADFSMDGVMKRYKELGGQLGNLVLRCSAERVNPGRIVPDGPGESGLGDEEKVLVDMLNSVRDEVTTAMESAQFSRALEQIIQVLYESNRYWDSQKPWELSAKATKGDTISAEKLKTSLYICFEAMRITSLLLLPIMPGKMNKLLDSICVESEARKWDNAVLGGRWTGLGSNSGENGGTIVQLPATIEPLFPRLK